MNTKLIAMFLFGIVFLFETVQEKGWKNIVPLDSTRKDVERLLGRPQVSKGVADTFQLKDGRLRVFYSDGILQTTKHKRLERASGYSRDSNL